MGKIIDVIVKFSTNGEKSATAAIGDVQNAAKKATRESKEAGKSAAAALNGAQKAAGVATHATSTLASTVGVMGGEYGKAASQVTGFVTSCMQLGVVGGIISGIQMALTKLFEYDSNKAEAFLAKVREIGDRVRENLDKMNQARMDKVSKALEEATTKAREAATAFDTMAAAYIRVQQAQDATAKSGRGVGMSELQLGKVRAMSGVNDDNARALIGAEYDVKIAEQQMKNTRAEQDAAVSGAGDDADIRHRQAIMARQAELKARSAKEKAEEEYNLDKEVDEVSGGRNGNLSKSKAAKEAAEKAYADAVNNRIAKVAEAEAAEERVVQAQNARSAALNESERNLIAARDAESRLIDAQRKAAQAELDRAKAAEKAAQAARQKAASDARIAALQKQKETLVAQTSSVSADAARFGGEFDRAFDLWRDPEAAQQAVDADRKRADDMKAFRKAVSRYGGKAKIDEYAELMRQGDEEGMQSRLAEWRKSSKFTPQVEQMVKAAAAEQNRNAAEKSLANIEKNTADLAKKIDELLKVKG